MKILAWNALPFRMIPSPDGETIGRRYDTDWSTYGSIYQHDIAILVYDAYT